MKNLKYFSIIWTVFFISACSNAKEELKESDDAKEIYVFDEPESGSEFDADVSDSEPPKIYSRYYMVQVGAFTTKEKAEEFAAVSKKKLDKKLSINYSDQVNLFVIQIDEKFEDRKEAEALRNHLWKSKEFKDAWILTISE